jgi:hypothetical protein
LLFLLHPNVHSPYMVSKHIYYNITKFDKLIQIQGLICH